MKNDNYDYLKESSNSAYGFDTHSFASRHYHMHNQTKDYLSAKNITKVDSYKFAKIKDIAAFLRFQYDNQVTGFPKGMLDYFNYSGVLMFKILSPNYHKYEKYAEIFDIPEEMALFVMLIIDPNLDYYNKYLENGVEEVGKYYGFVSKELLEVERLYDFIMKYKAKGQDDETIRYMANKLYHLEDAPQR